jgi:hypothetical protein
MLPLLPSTDEEVVATNSDVVVPIRDFVDHYSDEERGRDDIEAPYSSH